MKYIDREGKVWEEVSGQDKLLKLLYQTKAGRAILKILIRPGVSRAGGWLLEQKISRLLIRPFVKSQKIDLDLYEKQEFESYNDFFTRQIKKEFRPLEGGAETLVSPCDGKLSVYRIDDGRRFCIKDTEYTLRDLLHSRTLEERYRNGYACVFRLTVDDYHRYCYVDSGKKSADIRIPGVFHTVNPAANDVCPIYKENTREYSLLKSRHFGTILMMEVGALMVGRITNYHGSCQVERGQEKGRFEFGGSTIILLFQENKVNLDARLEENTKLGYETVVKMGERLGETIKGEL